MDVQRLCNAYIPAWLATGGMGADKISQFYDDPERMDGDCAIARICSALRLG